MCSRPGLRPLHPLRLAVATTSRLGSTGARSFRDAAARLRAQPIFVPLVALVIAGVGLRILTMVIYSTVVMDYYTGDASRYIRVGVPGIFGDSWQPAGYPMFLAAIRAITSWLPVTIGLQHLLGVATSLLLYAAARRAGASRYIALIPAAFVLLLGDYLFLEHGFLQESLWLVFLASGLYAAVRGLATGQLGWLAGGSVLLGFSGIVRNLSFVLPIVLAI